MKLHEKLRGISFSKSELNCHDYENYTPNSYVIKEMHEKLRSNVHSLYKEVECKVNVVKLDMCSLNFVMTLCSGPRKNTETQKHPYRGLHFNILLFSSA